MPVVVTESTRHCAWRKTKKAMAQPIVYGVISVGLVSAVGWTVRRYLRDGDNARPEKNNNKRKESGDGRHRFLTRRAVRPRYRWP